MKFVLFLFEIAIVVLILFYLRFFIKRILFFFRLRSACKKNGFKIHPSRKIWLLGTRKDTRCDFHIVSDKEVLSIKFFDAPIKMCNLHFHESGLYLFEYIIPLYRFCPPFEGNLKKFQNYDFTSCLDNEFQHKKQTKILLCHPSPNEVRANLRSGQLVLSPGDEIPHTGIVLFSAKALLTYLELSK